MTATPTRTPTPTPNRTATAAIQKTAAQAAINEMVGAELTKYGIDASKGHVVWVMDEPIEMDSSGFGQGFYQKIKNAGKLKDFVVQSRVTWDSSGALSGCGYLYRAPDDWDLNTGDWYELVIVRVQFAPAWFIAYYKDGYLQYNMPGGAGVNSKNLLDTKKSVNTLTLDAHGDKFTIYINGVKERTIENDRVEEGGLAFEVVQNSGTTYCKFSDSWVWVYDE